MKKRALRLTSLLLIVLMAVALIAPQSVEAATFKPAATYYLDMTANCKKYGQATETLLQNYTLKITKVTSSNTAVLKVKKTNGVFNLYPLKTGASNITVTYKDDNGKSQSFKTKVKVKSYSNPVKKFTVGSTSFTSRFKKDNNCQYNYKTEMTVKGKLTVTAAADWKIVKIQKFDFFTGKTSTLTNGKTYTFNAHKDRLKVTLKYTNGYIRTLTVNELG